MVSWKRHLANGTIVSIEDDGRRAIRQKWLIINNVQVDDTGDYQCVAHNKYYTRSSEPVFLTVVPSM